MNATKYAVWLFIALIIAFFAICTAYAAEQPNIQCNSGDLNADYACMKANWRPKKQISYDTAQPICNWHDKHLYGNGFIQYNVDDSLYLMDINCPPLPSEVAQ